MQHAQQEEGYSELILYRVSGALLLVATTTTPRRKSWVNSCVRSTASPMSVTCEGVQGLRKAFRCWLDPGA